MTSQVSCLLPIFPLEKYIILRIVSMPIHTYQETNLLFTGFYSYKQYTFILTLLFKQCFPPRPKVETLFSSHVSFLVSIGCRVCSMNSGIPCSFTIYAVFYIEHWKNGNQILEESCYQSVKSGAEGTFHCCQAATGYFGNVHIFTSILGSIVIYTLCISNNINTLVR